MFLFTGLGNPGQKYAMNRHNVGFMALDLLAELYAFPAWQKKAASLQTTGQINRNKIILLKPQSYMNNSGLPNADAYPPIILTKMPVNIAKTIMPAMPTALFHAHAPAGKIKLVMKDKNIVDWNLMESRHFGNGQARIVHVALRL